jgi:hypothetical protein
MKTSNCICTPPVGVYGEKWVVQTVKETYSVVLSYCNVAYMCSKEKHN